MFGWWEIMDFWNLYSWNAHSVYVFSLETFCKFGSMGGTTRFGPEESSTKFRSTGQFHNLGQLNVDFRLLWAGKIGGPDQVCVWNPWLCLNHTGYGIGVLMSLDKANGPRSGPSMLGHLHCGLRPIWSKESP